MANYLYPHIDQMTQDIIEGAKARGINPNYALRVTRAEGLQPGVWQSNYRYPSGVREKSYTPWQMNVDSPNALGSVFKRKTGLDPADPANWKAVNNFALDTVKKRGWGDWYGAKKVGITGMMGVNGEPMTLGPSEEKPMQINQPQFPGLDPTNAIDPRKLTPLQLAMIQAQGGGLMGPGSTPGLGAPNPMQLAMGQGDPSMFDPMAVPNNAPMNPNQSVPGGGIITPMQQAMKVSGGEDTWGDMAEEPAVTPEEKTPFWKSGDYWKRALIGAGAGLSMIDNPQGAAVAAAMLENLDEDSLTPYQWGMLGIRQRELENKEAKENTATAEKQAEARQRATSLRDQLGDMIDSAKEIRDDPSLELQTGLFSLVPTRPGSKASALQAKIDFLKARGKFNFLTTLRSLSTTGGALGQVSDYENREMEKAFARVAQTQNKADFQTALDEFVAQSQRSMTNINKAYMDTYGEELPGFESAYGGKNKDTTSSSSDDGIIDYQDFFKGF